MRKDGLVELAQSVATDLVRAKALGEDGVVASLQMAWDELLGRVADEFEAEIPESLGPKEEDGL